MSKVVPSKFMAPSSKLGVDSLKDIKVERVRLQPQAHANTTYTPTGLNRISWRLPAYANSMMDCSRSFLSFKLKMTESGSTLTGSNNAVFGNGLPIFNRILIKNSQGLVIEDITNFNVLSKILLCVSQEEDYNIDKGIYGTSEAPSTVGAELIPSANGIVYTYQFNTGVLSKDLAGYLPVFMMDGNGGAALDIELFLSPSSECISVNNAGVASDVSYELTEPVYNLCLLRMDQSLCSKFNEISCDPDRTIELPFTTFKTHTQVIQAQTNVVQISENGSNLKRIWSVYLDQNQTRGTSYTSPQRSVVPFRGSVSEANGQRLTKYNYRVGTTYLFNEPVQETVNNNVSLQYVKDSIWGMKKPMILSKTNSDQTATLYQADQKFFTVGNFEYSEESMNPAFVGGISSTNPVQLEFTLDSTPSSALVNHNFCEVGYIMSIRNGVVSYLEPKPGSQSVY
jgi:hypothetical protein